MTKFRKTVIKACSLLFLACAVFAFATMPGANTAKAEGDTFKVNGTSVYRFDENDDSKVGLRFEAEVTEAWFSGKTAEKYTFGMIIAPTANFEKAEAEGAEKPWSAENTPTKNNAIVDGVNFIRIQNKAKADIESYVFHAGILFDDYSLKTSIAERLNIKDTEVTKEQLESVREEFYTQSYSAVVYATYGGKTEYLARYNTSMRETAAKTYALGVAKNDEECKALALPYLDVNADNIYDESAYVVKGDKKLIVDSADEFTVNNGDIIIANGKAVDYTVDENGVVVLDAVDTTATKLVVFGENKINIIDVTYADRALSTPEDVVDYFTNKDNWTYYESSKTYSNNKSAVLTQDIDMASELIYNYNAVYYYGLFDGRGHVLSNVTLDILKEGTTTDGTFSLFGYLTSSGVVKNVAFDNIEAIDYNPNAGVLGYRCEGLIENVYVSYSVDNKARAGLFVMVEGGTMRNVVVMDNYYDPTFNIDTYMSDNIAVSGISSISRLTASANSKFENVQIISRRPVTYNCSNSNYDVTYKASEDGVTPATVSDWGARFIYGENETDLWYDFEYFYRAIDDVETPGLGIEAGKANVENTVASGKTAVYEGVRRYNTREAFLADDDNATNRAKLVATGMWKEDGDSIVWANNATLSKPCTYVNEVDYDASTGIMYTTVFNGEGINKITMSGVELTAEENGGLVVDGDGKIVGIRAKVNSSDENPGIAYRTTATNTTNVINYDGKIRIYTDSQVYVIRKVNYYTQLIFDVTDLREAVGYNIDYSIAELGSADKATDREAELNGKGYFVGTTLDSKKYYEGVLNVGYYKMMADVDMYFEDKENPENSGPTGIGYTNNPLTKGSRIGGFVGNFDGNGHSIKNYKADKQGLFGRVSNSVQGNEVNTGKKERFFSYVPLIKDLAIIDVITTYVNTTTQVETPILAITVGTDGYASPHKTSEVHNIYATVSKESTAMGSFITMVGLGCRMNNIYLVNENEFGMEEQNENKFRTVESGDRVNIKPEEGTKIYNMFKLYDKDTQFEGVLFGSAYTNTNTPSHESSLAKDTVNGITNTHVVTTMPINYYNYGKLFFYPYNYFGITHSVDGITFERGDTFYKLGKFREPFVKSDGTTDNGHYYMAIAYAANETVGTIPVMYSFRQSAIDDIKYIYKSTEEGGLGKTIGTSGSAARACNVCGDIKFNISSVKVVTSGKTKCQSNTGCTGTYVTVGDKTPNGTGQYASPHMYTFTYHTQADMSSYYSDSNGAWRLKYVYKYADVDAMTKANNDYSSFIGTAGNGLWKVNETETGRELVWVGRA